MQMIQKNTGMEVSVQHLYGRSWSFGKLQPVQTGSNLGEKAGTTVG